MRTLKFLLRPFKCAGSVSLSASLIKNKVGEKVKTFSDEVCFPKILVLWEIFCQRTIFELEIENPHKGVQFIISNLCAIFQFNYLQLFNLAS